MSEKETNPAEVADEHRRVCLANLDTFGRMVRAIGVLMVHSTKGAFESRYGDDVLGAGEVVTGIGELLDDLGRRVQYVRKEIEDTEEVAAGNMSPAKYLFKMWDTEE